MKDQRSVTDLQKRIAAVEGFQVSFQRLGALDVPIPDYPYDLMAPNKWTISDWKRIRLAPYILIFKGVDVYRGGDEVVRADIRLGTLRDSYYEARYGTLEPVESDNVTPLDPNRPRKSKKHP